MSKIKTKTLATLASIFSGPYDDIDVLSDESGWNVYALSKDKTSMMSATVPASAFQDYEPIGRLALDVDKMVAKLKNMGDETEVSLTHKGSRLTFSSDGFKDTMALLPAPDGQRRLPSIELDAGFMCDLSPLRKVVKATENQMVRFIIQEGGVSLQSFDESMCGPEADIPADSLMSIAGTASAGYSAQCLSEMLSKFPKEAMASIEMGDDLPMKMSFAVDGLEGFYFLAPWIEERRA